jgi:hypothetical protein
LIAFIGIALAGLPLWQLTHRAPVAMAARPAEIKSPSVHLEFTLTQPARKLSVRHLGKVVWSGEPADNVAEADIKIPWPPDGVDLRVQIDWPEKAPLAAARLRLTDPEGVEQEHTIWSAGPTDEVLTFR